MMHTVSTPVEASAGVSLKVTFLTSLLLAVASTLLK